MRRTAQEQHGAPRRGGTTSRDDEPRGKSKGGDARRDTKMTDVPTALLGSTTAVDTSRGEHEGSSGRTYELVGKSGGADPEKTTALQAPGNNDSIGTNQDEMRRSSSPSVVEQDACAAQRSAEPRSKSRVSRLSASHGTTTGSSDALFEDTFVNVPPTDLPSPYIHGGAFYSEPMGKSDAPAAPMSKSRVLSLAAPHGKTTGSSDALFEDTFVDVPPTDLPATDIHGDAFCSEPMGKSDVSDPTRHNARHGSTPATSDEPFEIKTGDASPMDLAEVDVGKSCPGPRGKSPSSVPTRTASHHDSGTTSSSWLFKDMTRAMDPALQTSSDPASASGNKTLRKEEIIAGEIRAEGGWLPQPPSS